MAWSHPYSSPWDCSNTWSRWCSKQRSKGAVATKTSSGPLALAYHEVAPSLSLFRSFRSTCLLLHEQISLYSASPISRMPLVERSRHYYGWMVDYKFWYYWQEWLLCSNRTANLEHFRSYGVVGFFSYGTASACAFFFSLLLFTVVFVLYGLVWGAV